MEADQMLRETFETKGVLLGAPLHGQGSSACGRQWARSKLGVLRATKASELGINTDAHPPFHRARDASRIL
eukprot:9065765-Pyramimonas_sp.AAC.1